MVFAASFTDFILGIHILAVVVSFGLLFTYPLLGLIGIRLEPQALPSWHRLQLTAHRRVAAPGLVVLLAAGIFLATSDHQWSKFYVGWGIAAVIAIGAIGGAYLIPREERLVELSGREVATGAGLPTGAAGDPEATGWSDEYLRVRREVEYGRLLQVSIAALTVFFMALHLGA